MDTFFGDHGIVVKDVPFGLSLADKPSIEDVRAVREELEQYDGFVLPEDYAQFCLANGGGTLGRVKM
jgi:hypothetical protein